MIRILFICHGNICRSPMGKYVLQDMVNKAGLSHQFEIDSAAVSREEIGNPVYPPARRELAKHGIACEGHAARQVTMKDYHHFDRIYYMDTSNARWLSRMLPRDPPHRGPAEAGSCPDLPAAAVPGNGHCCGPCNKCGRNGGSPSWSPAGPHGLRRKHHASPSPVAPEDTQGCRSPPG